MSEQKPTPKEAQAETQSPLQNITMEELLEKAPLHSQKDVYYLFSRHEGEDLKYPSEIHVHCDHVKCDGIRRHTKVSSNEYAFGQTSYAYVLYACTNCVTGVKIFGLKAIRVKGVTGTCTKIYQEPT